MRASDAAVVEILFLRLGEPFPARLAAAAEKATPLLKTAERELMEYFAGRRTTFDLPLEPVGTDFQREVWRALTRIPFGRTVGYGAIAAAVNRPQAARAVGNACGANPIPILIPCHRVVASGGRLGGFSCGLDFKKFLLTLETKKT